MEFDEVQAWSNAQPALYFLQAVLSVNGEPMDDLIERVGFRTVTLDGSKIMVNGEAVYLKGFIPPRRLCFRGLYSPTSSLWRRIWI